MADVLAIFVCDTATNAENARTFLIEVEKFPPDSISIEKVGVGVSYDAKTYGGGGHYDVPLGKWVVIGRK
jgi:hypothetical protein